eukprot:gene18102-27881_t
MDASNTYEGVALRRTGLKLFDTCDVLKGLAKLMEDVKSADVTKRKADEWAAKLREVAQEAGDLVTDGTVYGVIQLINKQGGNRDFHAQDEIFAQHAATFMAYVMSTYPCPDLEFHAFDPAAIHTKYQPALRSKDALYLHSFDSTAPHRRQLIMREVPAGRGAGKAKGSLEYAPSAEGLVDVVKHVAWLEQSWLAAVELNRKYQEQVIQSGSIFRAAASKLTVELATAKKELFLYKELLTTRTRLSAGTDEAPLPQSSIEAVKTKATFLQSADNSTSLNDSFSFQNNLHSFGDAFDKHPGASLDRWKPGDLAYVSEDPDHVAACYARLGKAFPFGDVEDVVGTICTVVRVADDCLELRSGEARGMVPRGVFFELPKTAVNSQAADETFLAAFQRRRSLHHPDEGNTAAAAPFRSPHRPADNPERRVTRLKSRRVSLAQAPDPRRSLPSDSYD